MDKKTFWRPAMLAVLFVIAAVLGVLCLFQSCTAKTTFNPAEAPTFTQPRPTPYVAWGVKVEPVELPDTVPMVAEPTETQAQPDSTDGGLGVLTIGRKEIPIADNVDESTLSKTPGWMPESTLPGDNGMCVILGHRNRKHLRPLEKVQTGDEIIFTYPDGCTASYIVAETMIYENTADWRLPPADGDALMLVTCWPFYYSGSAPGKYVVFCERL